MVGTSMQRVDKIHSEKDSKSSCIWRKTRVKKLQNDPLRICVPSSYLGDLKGHNVIVIIIENAQIYKK
jgi:hypothetical protein